MSCNGLVTVELLEQQIAAIVTNEDDKGSYADEAALIAAYPVGQLNWFAYNQDTESNWHWNTELTAWVNQCIAYAAWQLLTAAERAGNPRGYHVGV